MAVKKNHTTDDGVNHITLVPSAYEDASIGVPVDVYHILDEFYQECPKEFRTRLYKQLWDVNLREPSDFLASDAKTRYMQALRHAIASDSTDAIRFILDTISK